MKKVKKDGSIRRGQPDWPDNYILKFSRPMRGLTTKISRIAKQMKIQHKMRKKEGRLHRLVSKGDLREIVNRIMAHIDKDHQENVKFQKKVPVIWYYVVTRCEERPGFVPEFKNCYDIVGLYEADNGQDLGRVIYQIFTIQRVEADEYCIWEGSG